MKLIATDMDGTLLNSQGKVSKENAQAIISAQEKGVKFVLASGRPLEAMTTFIEQLYMDKYNSYIIAFNGAVIYDTMKKENIFEIALSEKQIEHIKAMSKYYSVNYVSYVNGKIFADDINEHTKFEANLTGLDIDTFDKIELKDNKLYKFMFISTPEKIRQIYEDYKDKCAEFGLSITISNPKFLEIIDEKVNKGLAITQLCSIISIDLDNVISCGDSYNDIPMLEISGLSVAADNANETVKSICKYISVNNNENILEDVIKKYI